MSSALLVIENDTPRDFFWVWVCTPEDSCDIYLQGVGLRPGSAVDFQYCPGEYIAAVVDDQQGCAVSPWFSLADGGEYDWDVTAMSGYWPVEYEFGCY